MSRNKTIFESEGRMGEATVSKMEMVCAEVHREIAYPEYILDLDREIKCIEGKKP